MQLNSAPLITHEAVKGPSARPLNPTPTVFNFSAEISQKYNTTSKEVILNHLRDFKGWNDSLGIFFQVFLFVCHTITLLKDAKRKKEKNVGRDGEEA